MSFKNINTVDKDQGSNLIQYKKVVVPGNYENAHASNVATWQK
jgi:hypothetical protein